MGEVLFKSLLTVVLTLLIKGGVAMAGHWIAWWLAAVIAFIVIFGGWLIIVNIDEVWR